MSAPKPDASSWQLPIIAPCGECAHERVCAIKATLAGNPTATLSISKLLPELEPLATATRHVIVNCAEFLDRGSISVVDAALAEPVQSGSASTITRVTLPKATAQIEPQEPDARDLRMFAVIREGAPSYVFVDQRLKLTASTTYGRLALLSRYHTLPADIERWRESRVGRGRPQRAQAAAVRKEPSPSPSVVETEEMFEARRDRLAKEAAGRTWAQRHPGESATAQNRPS